MTHDEAQTLLGLENGADTKQVRSAYLRLLKKHKPERDPSGFQRLREAYELAEQVAQWHSAGVYLGESDEDPDEMDVDGEDPFASGIGPYYDRLDDIEDSEQRIAIAREAVELMQRLDCKLDTVLIGGHGYVGPGEAIEKKTHRARGPITETRAMRRALGRKPEVILMGAALWNWFPVDVRYEIMRQVAQDGTGLLFCAPLGLTQGFYRHFGT